MVLDPTGPRKAVVVDTVAAAVRDPARVKVVETTKEILS